METDARGKYLVLNGTHFKHATKRRICAKCRVKSFRHDPRVRPPPTNTNQWQLVRWSMTSQQHKNDNANFGGGGGADTVLSVRVTEAPIAPSSSARRKRRIIESSSSSEDEEKDELEAENPSSDEDDVEDEPEDEY